MEQLTLNVPKVDVPKVAVPKVDVPKVAVPKVAVPKVDDPKVADPKVDDPKVDDQIVDKCKTDVSTLSLINNRGTGAGGANTNKNGKMHEKTCLLETEWENEMPTEDGQGLIITFKDDPTRTFIYATQAKFTKHMKSQYDCNVNKLHGCKYPDQAIIDKYKRPRTLHIMEGKYQNHGGSVCEKIQSASWKKENYEKQFPRWRINYMYVLSRYFEEKCKAELEMLEKYKIPYFILNNADDDNENTNVKKKIIRTILEF
jgi:hypothetical protein